MQFKSTNLQCVKVSVLPVTLHLRQAILQNIHQMHGKYFLSMLILAREQSLLHCGTSKGQISCKRLVSEQHGSYILQLFFAYAAVRKTLLSGYAYTALKTDLSPFFMTKEKLCMQKYILAYSVSRILHLFNKPALLSKRFALSAGQAIIKIFYTDHHLLTYKFNNITNNKHQPQIVKSSLVHLLDQSVLPLTPSRVT